MNQFQISTNLSEHEHAQSYSQHQRQLLFSHRDPSQGCSRDSSPPSIWFNPDQMLIGLFGCWPSAWAAGQLWQAVPSCAVQGLPAKVSAAQRPLHKPKDTSRPIVHTYCEQTPWRLIWSNWSFHDLWGSLSISHSHTLLTSISEDFCWRFKCLALTNAISS